MSNAFNFPTGTVKLLVTQSGEEITSLVSADALVMASPVWKKFLFPPWEQTGSSINSEPPAGERTAKQIDCRGDDGDALLVLLNIIHLRFSLVPKKPGYVLLLQLAVLVDQYDCIDITRPWLESWMEGETTECVREDQEGWLFISWVFGRDATFKKLSRHLVTKSTAGPLSTESDVDLQVLLTPSGKYFLDTMPPEILGTSKPLTSLPSKT